MKGIRQRRRLARTATCLTLAGIIGACQGAERPMSSDVASATAGSPDRGMPFVGTWRLTRVERRDQTGAPLPDFVHPTIGHGEPVGYVMYDGERMGVVVQQEGRTIAGDEPTADEALGAVESFTAYFGPFSVNTAEGYVSHQVTGSLNPRGAGGETQPFYEILENQLILTPSLECPDSFLTDRGCGYGTTGIQLRNVWEKLAPSTAAASDPRFLGFWEIDRVERHTLDGREVPTRQYAEGSLMYMPSGFMAVHLMRQDRAPYKGLRPTAAEAEAAMQSYVSYVGRFNVHASEGVVVHERAGHINPNNLGIDAIRGFEFRDGQLILKPPVSVVDGQEVQTQLVWNRLSSLEP